MKNELVLLKYSLMVQTKRKLEKRLPLKYNYSSGKMKQKMEVAFTEMQFNGQDKKESREAGCH